MRTISVAESVDIEAPRAEVFAIIANCDRRLQLSPLWGVVQLVSVSPDFPATGGSYRLRMATGERAELAVSVTDYVRDHKFAYRLEAQDAEQVVWRLHEVAGGTRLMYEETFLLDESSSPEEVIAKVRDAIVRWLASIRRYAELRGTRSRRVARLLVDRGYLRLGQDQRRLIILILALHGVGALSFLAAALSVGVARLLFG